MPELAQERINFIEQLHEVFLRSRGYGAFAYISVTEVLHLFDQYVGSGEPASVFINRYVRAM